MVASPSKPLRLVVGIDGGGTSTKCVVSSVPVSSSAVIVGVGEGGSANANSVGFDAALENVAGAIVAALRDATRENFRYRPEDVLAGDVEGVKLEAIALSCAGVDDDDGKARWRDALASLCVAVPPRRVVVANDAAAALASGTRGRLHGVVLISGTGTIACGYTEDGARARAAGWGPAFGDAGCAHSIGSALLALAARVADGRVAPSSPGAALVPEIMETLGLDSAEDLIGWAYEGGPAPAWADVAALAPVATRAAARGDAYASGLLDDAAEGLLESLRAVCASLARGESAIRSAPFSSRASRMWARRRERAFTAGTRARTFSEKFDVGSPLGRSVVAGAFDRDGDDADVDADDGVGRDLKLLPLVLAGGMLREGGGLAERLKEGVRRRADQGDDGTFRIDGIEFSAITHPTLGPEWGAAYIAERALEGGARD